MLALLWGTLCLVAVALAVPSGYDPQGDAIAADWSGSPSETPPPDGDAGTDPLAYLPFSARYSASELSGKCYRAMTTGFYPLILVSSTDLARLRYIGIKPCANNVGVYPKVVTVTLQLANTSYVAFGPFTLDYGGIPVPATIDTEALIDLGDSFDVLETKLSAASPSDFGGAFGLRVELYTQTFAPPVIAVQPADVTLWPGELLNLAVNVTEGEPATHVTRWARDGVVIAGLSTDATIDGAYAVTEADEALWVAEADNTAFNTTSAAASVTVWDAPAVAPTVSCSPASTSEVQVSWTHVLAAGVGPLTGFELFVNESAQVPVVASSPTTLTVSADVHAFTVRAVNQAGDGPVSTEVYCQPLDVPAAPLVPVCSNAGLDQFDVTWSAVTATPAVDDYKLIVERVFDAVFVVDATHGSAQATNPLAVTSLAFDTEYRVRVAAVNSVGQGAFSADALCSTTGTAPDPPLSLACGTSAPRSQQLTWAATAAAQGPVATLYHIERDGSLIGSTTSLSYTDEDSLDFLETYTYDVAAVNEYGTGLISSVDCTTTGLVPHKPEFNTTHACLEGTPSTSGVRWPEQNVTDGPPIDSYIIYRNGTQVGTPAVGEFEFTDTGLTWGTYYAYEFAAVNTEGASPLSDPVLCRSGWNVPAAPSNAPTCVDASPYTLTVAWNGSSSVADGPSITSFGLLRSSGVHINISTPEALPMVGHDTVELGLLTDYSYSVYAVSEAGVSAFSPAVTCTTTFPLLAGIRFVTPPLADDLVPNANMTQRPIIEAYDKDSNLIPGGPHSIFTVRLVIASASHPGAGLFGVYELPMVGGIANFTDFELGFNSSGTFTLAVETVDYPGPQFLSPQSAPLVVFHRADHLVFETQPVANVLSGQPFSTMPVVHVMSKFDEIVTEGPDANVAVSLTAGPVDAVLAASVTTGSNRVASAGTVSGFLDIAVDVNDTIFRDDVVLEAALTPVPDGLVVTTAVSVPLTIFAVATDLAFATPPAGNVLAVDPGIGAPVVDILDSLGNVILAGPHAELLVTLDSATGTLSGSPLAVVAANGNAQGFDNLAIDEAGSVHTLSASAMSNGSPITTTSPTFTIFPLADSLVIDVDPVANVQTDVLWPTQPVVRVRDSGNATLTAGPHGNGVVVTVALLGGNGGAAGAHNLTGSDAQPGGVTVASGLATFSNLALESLSFGTDFVLVFSLAVSEPNAVARVLTVSTVVPIVVEPRLAAMDVLVQPVGNVLSGNVLATLPSVVLLDAAGYTVSIGPDATATVQLALGGGDGAQTLGGAPTSLAAVGGTADWSAGTLSVTSAVAMTNMTFSFAVPAFPLVVDIVSAPFVVHAPGGSLVFAVEPVATDVTEADALTVVPVVHVLDASGNRIVDGPHATANVSLELVDLTLLGDARLASASDGDLWMLAVAGIASGFAPDMRVTGAGNVHIRASAPDLGLSVDSGLLTIFPAAAEIVFVAAPAAVVVDRPWEDDVVVEVLDRSGLLVTSGPDALLPIQLTTGALVAGASLAGGPVTTSWPNMTTLGQTVFEALRIDGGIRDESFTLTAAAIGRPAITVTTPSIRAFLEPSFSVQWTSTSMRVWKTYVDAPVWMTIEAAEPIIAVRSTLSGDVDTSFVVPPTLTLGAVDQASGSVKNASLAFQTSDRPGSASFDVRLSFGADGHQFLTAARTITIAVLAYPVPTIASISPAVGRFCGSTTVTISGSSFGLSPSNLTAVRLGGISCASHTWVSEQRVTCVTPSLSADDDAGFEPAVETVFGVSASSLATPRFTVAARPVVDSIHPTVIGAATPTTLEIYGSDFAGTSSSVTVGGRNCPLVSVNATGIACAVPLPDPSTVGTAPQSVLVSTPLGCTSAASPLADIEFRAPRTSAVAPASVRFNGGSLVTVFGANFGTSQSDIAGVSLAGVPCAGSTRISASVLVCIAGSTADATASGPVLVTTHSGGTGPTLIADDFFYYDLAPVLAQISPTRTPTGIRPRVTVTGQYFGVNASTVTEFSVAGIDCLGAMTWVSGEELQCQMPLLGTPVNGSITVRAGPLGLASTGLYFEATGDISSFAPEPLLVRPSKGSIFGGELVTISGNFFPTSDNDLVGVWLGDSTCLEPAVSSNGSAVVCKSSAPDVFGAVPAIVETFSGGRGTGLVLDAMFTFIYPPPLPTGFFPRSGTRAGGTRVTVSGQYFGMSDENPLTIRMAGVACAEVERLSSDKAVCVTVPESALRPGTPISLHLSTAQGGAMVVGLPYLFTYLDESQLCDVECGLNAECVDKECRCISGWIGPPDCLSPAMSAELVELVPMVVVNDATGAVVRRYSVDELAIMEGDEWDDGTGTTSLVPELDEEGKVVIEVQVKLNGPDPLHAPLALSIELTDETESRFFGTERFRWTPSTFDRPQSFRIGGRYDAVRDGHGPTSVVFTVETEDEQYRDSYLAPLDLYVRDAAPIVLSTSPLLAPLNGTLVTLVGVNLDDSVRLFVDDRPVTVVRTRSEILRSRTSASSSTFTSSSSAGSGPGRQTSDALTPVDPDALPPYDPTDVPFATYVEVSIVFWLPAFEEEGYRTVRVVNDNGDSGSHVEQVFFTDDCPTAGMWGRGAECKPCPEGAECPGGYRLWPKPGYWTSSESAGYVEQCEPVTACPGGPTSPCAMGYAGDYCGKCAEGYVRQNDECEACPGPTTLVMMIFTLVVMWVAIGCAVALIEQTSMLSVALSWFFAMQMLGAVGQLFPGEMPGALRQVYRFYYLFSGDFLFLQPDCLGTFTYEGLFLLRLFFAFAVGAPIHAAVFIARQISIRRWAARADSEIVHEAVFIRKDHFANRQVRALVIHAMLIYYTLTVTAMDVVGCTNRQEGRRLLTNSAQACMESGFYWGIFALSLLILLGGTIGLPVTYGWWQWRTRDTAMRSRRVSERYDAVYERFRFGRRFAWVFDPLSLVMVAAGDTLTLGIPRAQFTLVVCILAAKFLFLLGQRPHRRTIEASGALVSTLLNLVALFFVFSARSDLFSSDGIAASGFGLLIASIGFILVFGAVCFYLVVVRQTEYNPIDPQLLKDEIVPDHEFGAAPSGDQLALIASYDKEIMSELSKMQDDGALDSNLSVADIARVVLGEATVVKPDGTLVNQEFDADAEGHFRSRTRILKNGERPLPILTPAVKAHIISQLQARLETVHRAEARDAEGIAEPDAEARLRQIVEADNAAAAGTGFMAGIFGNFFDFSAPAAEDKDDDNEPVNV